jgi:hypothetical protein
MILADSAMILPPTLARHVSGIVAAAAEKHVGRIHTGGHIAMMQHAQIVSYRTIGEFPGDSMSPDRAVSPGAGYLPITTIGG